MSARRSRCSTPWPLMQGPDRGTSSPRRCIAGSCGDGGARVTGALVSPNTFVRETERADRDWCKLRQSPVYVLLTSSRLLHIPPSEHYAHSPQLSALARTTPRNKPGQRRTAARQAAAGRSHQAEPGLRTGRSAINRNARPSPSRRMHIRYPRGWRRKPPPQNTDSDTATAGVVTDWRRPASGMRATEAGAAHYGW